MPGLGGGWACSESLPASSPCACVKSGCRLAPQCLHMRAVLERTVEWVAGILVLYTRYCSYCTVAIDTVATVYYCIWPRRHSSTPLGNSTHTVPRAPPVWGLVLYCTVFCIWIQSLCAGTTVSCSWEHNAERGGWQKLLKEGYCS